MCGRNIYSLVHEDDHVRLSEYLESSLNPNARLSLDSSDSARSRNRAFSCCMLIKSLSKCCSSFNTIAKAIFSPEYCGKNGVHINWCIVVFKVAEILI